MKLLVEQAAEAERALIGWRRAAEEPGRTRERNSRARFGYMEGALKKIEIKKPKVMVLIMIISIQVLIAAACRLMMV
jgi:hypothetical protein